MTTHKDNMKYICAVFTLIFVLFNTACTDNSKPISPIIIDRQINGHWVDIFYESIRDKNSHSGIEDLQKKNFDKSDYELRIYAGFGEAISAGDGHPLDLLILKIKDDKLISYHYPIWQREPIIKNHDDFKLWNDLCHNEILSLPDSAELEDYPLVLGGVSFVIEMKNSEKFSHYEYGNPDYSQHSESKKLLECIEIIKNQTTFNPYKPLN